MATTPRSDDAILGAAGESALKFPEQHTATFRFAVEA
jgi:hypothetical protein